MLFKHFTFLSNCSILLSEGERQNPTEKERKIFKHQKGKTMKKYQVTFTTKKGGFQRWEIRLTAETAKIAIAKARIMWDTKNTSAHMFGIEAKRLENNIEIEERFIRI